ncbi:MULTISPECIES: GNAT family N-acetyltransferase [Streptomyces]|uniref:GNAT family protein n=1 Tax=Streptomyces glycanivorans TaxID=3033808 RepID=A0ABY9JEG3_9ACTN|nr:MULTISPECIES: GNAT family protein [unclassified Streptomyces]WSQ79545.1 GNAT family N-acetyltransferase [Streptomyces sp. NBC_01213]TXS09217.1 N-acetyltransferase [Streptomyces sp. wa22]WLQ66105.1 GNAT family protein [Streptomyces sp. Alt3]WSQ86925.1 GNAT family N-acetyltransferase [Streptomyces sp. NBC_01212]WSR07057.1 GNAT family N-acetyltransferase [Streptomyces sp. NBC_01208]
MIDDIHPLADGVGLRPATLGDAESFAEAYTRSRAYMRRWEPVRPDTFYTVEGQVQRLTGLLADRDAGRVMPWALADDQDRVVGAVTLASIERGPFRNARLGYWTDVDRAGRGLATAAVTRVCELARDGLGLHRIAAGTVLDNVASQRVLAKCGFELYGTAPRYLHINGAWQDHRMFQRILHDGPPQG